MPWWEPYETAAEQRGRPVRLAPLEPPKRRIPDGPALVHGRDYVLADVTEPPVAAVPARSGAQRLLSRSCTCGVWPLYVATRKRGELCGGCDRAAERCRCKPGPLVSPPERRSLLRDVLDTVVGVWGLRR